MGIKEKAPRITARKTQKFEFTEVEYIDTEKGEIEKPKGPVYEYEIQEPEFENITLALSQRRENGQLDLIGAGKVIWENCCVACSEEIDKQPKLLISICLELATKYALPIDIKIKKK